MKSAIYLLLIISLLSNCMGTKPDIATEVSIDDHLNRIMNMWEGQFRNSHQIREISDKGGDIWRIDDSGEGGFLDVTSHYIKLNRPDIGSHVMYVEEYRDEKPDETYRQRIYTLAVDSTQTIRVKMWPFKDKKKYVGSWKDISMLSNLTTEEISAYPDICDLIVESTEEGYYMYMNGSDCTFGSKTFNYEVKLKEDVFSYRDKITDTKDGSITSAGAFAYHHLDKIEQ